MSDYLRNLLWWRSDKTLKYDGTIYGGYYKLPSDSQRKCMNPKELAILLSKCEKETPAYILVEHELNRRIAKVQAIPSYIGIISGLSGVVLGAWLDFSYQEQKYVECTCDRSPTTQRHRTSPEPMPSIPTVRKSHNKNSNEK